MAVAIERFVSRSTGFGTERRDDDTEVLCLFSTSFVVVWHSGYPLWFDRFSIGVLGWSSRSSAVAEYE